jgi:hypothetical protein
MKALTSLYSSPSCSRRCWTSLSSIITDINLISPDYAFLGTLWPGRSSAGYLVGIDHVFLTPFLTLNGKTISINLLSWFVLELNARLLLSALLAVVFVLVLTRTFLGAPDVASLEHLKNGLKHWYTGCYDDQIAFDTLKFVSYLMAFRVRAG